ncbi:MAG: type II toxin-antitoxin system HicA family toxin [Tannerella sp.]|nr:type II toxin-antitoxin system HicA family toxin [Tannerella sp.]
MKRSHLIKHIRQYNCSLLREGSNHSWYQNDATGSFASVPRHNEIKDILANAICKQLEIPRIK